MTLLCIHSQKSSLVKVPLVQFLVAVLLLGASDAKRTLRGNARPSLDNRDAVIIIIIIILNLMRMR